MARATSNRIDFGKFLVDRKFLRPEQLDELLRAEKGARPAPDRVRDLLLKQGLLSEEDGARVLAEFYELPYINLRCTLFDPLAVQKVGVELAEKHTLIPFLLCEKELSVAFKTYDFTLVDQLKQSTGCNILVHVASRAQILEAIEIQYASYITSAAKSRMDLSELVESGEDSEPIQRFSNGLILDAIKERASDIHIEPQDTFVRIRYRIDGVLEEKLKLPSALLRQLVSRYKIMGNLDIGESRRPQDGRIRFVIGTREFDLRLSIVPASYGEKVVMRILDKLGVSLNLDNMHMSKLVYKRVRRAIRTINGIFFVTGPTGSGKTTTCYAALNLLNDLERNIVTIEDPIEYRLPIINQIQVRHEIGLDFAATLRAVLRQDPDTILVGEIRDLETARIATQAAMTGHLVLSTLHTNNAVEAVLRLVDIGVEPFLVAPTIIGVLSQRLVRRVCPHCRQSQPVTPDQLPYLRLKPGERDVVLYRGTGCPACRNTGYLGRIAIQEIIVVTEQIRQLIMKSAPMKEIEDAAKTTGYRTMREDGLKKALLGQTSLEEVLRITRSEEDFFI